MESINPGNLYVRTRLSVAAKAMRSVYALQRQASELHGGT